MTRSTQVTTPRYGFTLIEMLVVLAIIGVVLAITISGQRAFNSSTVLSNTAYDVALSVRQAQTYGVSGRVVPKQPSANYGYGIDVSSIPTNNYVLFADTFGTGCSIAASSIKNAPDTKIGDCIYTPNRDIIVHKFKINNNARITGMCVYKGLSTYCSTGSNNPSLSKVDITFVRPNPSAIIIANSERFNRVCIRLSAGDGNRYINVTQIGVISVKPSCTDL